MAERCPKIENLYFCLQSNLLKHQPCLAEFIRTGRNSCPRTLVHFSESSPTQINAKEYFLIPATTTKIKCQCNSKGIYEIKQPSIITLNQCIINIDGKIFQIEEGLHEEYVFNLPSIETPTTNTNGKRYPVSSPATSKTIRPRIQQAKAPVDKPQIIMEPLFSDLEREELLDG
ncbi:hypothetical protein ILUMI_15087 [Ignelater luminosus]|uniref:Uncharacterized protein n=1 Tax=Ignelater luminosus TaxID=2038154 RepID=A0A8K0CTR1_IGNLU|nr:hypothetical protein ILUMI_15087 [Ignelater luminosus]